MRHTLRLSPLSDDLGVKVDGAMDVEPAETAEGASPSRRETRKSVEIADMDGTGCGTASPVRRRLSRKTTEDLDFECFAGEGVMARQMRSAANVEAV